MDRYGLGIAPEIQSGIGEGVGNLFKGLLGVKGMFDQDRRHNDDKAFKERQLAIDAARYGLLRGPDDSYTQSPEAAEQKAFKQRMLNMGLEKNALELEKLKREQSPEALDQAARGKVTQGQWASGGYLNRLKQAEQALDSPKEDYDPTSAMASFKGYLPELMKSGGQKQQEQAELNFITAQLRKESGAAISSGEIANAKKQYFPQPGDSPKVLEQKKQNRLQAMQNLQGEAGPALKYLGEPAGLLANSPSQKSNMPRGLLPNVKESSVAGSNDENSEALDWARSNPQDPRAGAILKRLGVK